MNRINLIALGVLNIEKARTFYKGLGFQCYDDSPDAPIIFFNNQGTKLELFPLEQLATDIAGDEPMKINREGFNGITLAMNAKKKEEVDEVMERARSLGAEIVKEPVIVSWGGYSGYFRDLDGYYWEVAYADTWAFDDQNMLVIDS